MNIVSAKKLVEAIKRLDKNTGITLNMLEELFKKQKILLWKHGKRTVGDMNVLIKNLNDLFSLTNDESLPRIRSIRKGYLELRAQNPCLGISEERIRFLVKMGVLPHVSIGNRDYIAMESFEPPYDECLMFHDIKSNKEEQKNQSIDRQLEAGATRRKKRKMKGGS